MTSDWLFGSSFSVPAFCHPLVIFIAIEILTRPPPPTIHIIRMLIITRNCSGGPRQSPRNCWQRDDEGDEEVEI